MTKKHASLKYQFLQWSMKLSIRTMFGLALHSFVVGGLMSWLCYLCLVAYSCVQHILCFVCLRLVHRIFPVFRDCPCLTAPLVFSKVLLMNILYCRTILTIEYGIQEIRIKSVKIRYLLFIHTTIDDSFEFYQHIFSV
jgi:hypothetical protein